MSWVLWGYLALGHPGAHTRITALDTEIQASGECPGEALMARGQAYAQMRHFADALADFTAAEICEPGLQGLQREVGATYFAAGHYMEAEARLARGLEGAPTDGAALVLHGRALLQLGRYAEADTRFEAALTEGARTTPDHYLWWSEARENAGRVAGALEVTELSLERLPGVPALEQRALALELKLGLVDEALARLDRGIARRPGPVLLLQRAQILERAGWADQATAAYLDVLTSYDALTHRQVGGANLEARDTAAIWLAEHREGAL